MLIRICIATLIRVRHPLKLQPRGIEFLTTGACVRVEFTRYCSIDSFSILQSIYCPPRAACLSFNCSENKCTA